MSRLVQCPHFHHVLNAWQVHCVDAPVRLQEVWVKDMLAGFSMQVRGMPVHFIHAGGCTGVPGCECMHASLGTAQSINRRA